MKYPFSRKLFELGIKNYWEKFQKHNKMLNDVGFISITFKEYIELLLFKSFSACEKLKIWVACFWCKRGLTSLWYDFLKKHPNHRDDLQAFDDWLVHKFKLKEAQYGFSSHGTGGAHDQRSD